MNIQKRAARVIASFDPDATDSDRTIAVAVLAEVAKWLRERAGWVHVCTHTPDCPGCLYDRFANMVADELDPPAPAKAEKGGG